jgi:hypothetical protein
LDPDCARVISYTIKNAVGPYHKGLYLAVTKVWTTQGETDAFFAKFPKTSTGSEAIGYYGGKWTPQQLCEIEKSKLVSFSTICPHDPSDIYI